MKKFKQIDIYGQFFLIIASIGFSINSSDGTFLICYYVVGSWQVISAAVHKIDGGYKSPGRTLYNNFLRVLLIVGIAVTLFLFISPVLLLIYLLGLLFIAPVLAILYACLCYNETYNSNKLSPENITENEK